MLVLDGRGVRVVPRDRLGVLVAQFAQAGDGGEPYQVAVVGTPLRPSRITENTSSANARDAAGSSAPAYRPTAWRQAAGSALGRAW
ncbi:hypothetical protein ACFQYP_08180 [Nonomuraea antimicrobica]